MADLEAGHEVAVAGRVCLRSLADFERACLVHIAEEQERAVPDTALIGVLCDAVRLSREHADNAKREAVR